MLTRVGLVLLCWFCLWIRAQQREPDSWADQVLLSNGLCRYGNSVECCWGWRQMDQGRCQPLCQQDCKHGDCVGPDRCRCHPGFTGKACNHDVNECGVKPRPCKHRCMNTPGSYKCYCVDGYTVQPDGSCRNAQTCYHANCQYGCEVMKGAVRCTCPSPGLRLGPDRRTCVDIDECERGGGACPRRRKCVNTFGSFLCKCHLGFRLAYINGRYTCIDKDMRPFCSLNPSSPKCRCKDGSCKAVLKVTLEPQRLRTTSSTRARTTTPITSTTATTTPLTTTTTTAQPTTTIATTTPATTTTSPIPTTSTTTSTLQPTTELDTTTLTLPTTTSTTTPATTTASTLDTSTATTTTTTTTTTASTTTTTTPLTTTTTTTTTTTASTTTTTTTPPLPTTTLSTTVEATTVNNRINKDVTRRQRGDVHIPRNPGLNQVWEFDIELGNTAEDARDDPEVAELRCSFDHGLCGWMSEREGDLYWETTHSPADSRPWTGITGETGARSPGPESNTQTDTPPCLVTRASPYWTTLGGRYLSVPELKAGQRSIRGARLAVQIVPPWNHSDLCYSFSHWLTGHHVGVLQLFVRKKGRDQRYSSALWSRTGGHGWRHTQVTLMSHSVDKVLLKAERRTGQRGQIALDDVTLRRGACR